MKIYPSTHQIKAITSKNIDLDLNIPLARIELDYNKYKIDSVISEKFNKDIKQEVLYNQEFDSSNIKLFNNFLEEVPTDNLLTRVGNKYYYRPKNAISFIPQNFNYKATVKQDRTYSISNKYNINIACVDDPDSLSLSNTIAQGFSNPSAREIAPPNISINNDKVDAYAFTNISATECDLLFIDSPDGVYYDDNRDPIKIDKQSFFDNNIILWTASEFNKNYPHDNTIALTEFKFKSPCVINNATFLSSTYFNINEMPYNPNITYHNLFESELVPVLIVEHIGIGFEIISHTSVYENLKDNIKSMYEIIMYCYLRNYKTTETLSQWITKEIPDYQLESGKLVKKKYFNSTVDIYKYFGLNTNELSLFSVDIFNSDNSNIPNEKNTDLFEPSTEISFIGMNGGYLMFNKDSSPDSRYNIEPIKPMGWTSLYNGEEVIYLEDLHYIVETDLNSKIFFTVNDLDLDVKILAFKSTSLGINLELPISKVIPFIKTEVNNIERIREAEYTFYIDLDNQDVNYNFKEDYEALDSAIKDSYVELFNIRVYQTPDAITVTDMRQLGGGLKEDKEDNYNLLDIGHINGRPYRQAGTLVFTLPKKYEQYESIILKAINKYIGASELPVLLFEDKK